MIKVSSSWRLRLHSSSLYRCWLCDTPTVLCSNQNLKQLTALIRQSKKNLLIIEANDTEESSHDMIFQLLSFEESRRKEVYLKRRMKKSTGYIKKVSDVNYHWCCFLLIKFPCFSISRPEISVAFAFLFPFVNSAFNTADATTTQSSLFIEKKFLHRSEFKAQQKFLVFRFQAGRTFSL